MTAESFPNPTTFLPFLPPSNIEVEVEVEVALDKFVEKSSQSMDHSRKRKSPLNRTHTSNGRDNRVTLIDDISGAGVSPTSIKGKTLPAVSSSHPYEHGLTRKCRPDFFVQLDPGSYTFIIIFR